MLQSGDQIIPGFTLDSFLGRGEFGQVWRAVSPGGTHLALKFLDLRKQQGRKEFRAVQRIKGIRHPHLLQTYAMWLLDEAMNVIEDTAFENLGNSTDSLRGTIIPAEITSKAREPRMLVIATALCDKDLSHRMKECQEQSLPGIPEDELLEYMADAAKAIDFLNAPRHELDGGLSAIHHCDIKPANIMLVSGSAVVGDLGVARVFASNADSARATSVSGSLAYSAPEMFENRTEETTDQYALAITYYELRTGKLPLETTSFAQMVRDKTAGRLAFDAVSPAERKVLERATAVQPAQRYRTAIEFVNELSNCSITTPVRMRSSVPIARFVATVSAFLVIATIAVYAVYRPVPETEPGVKDSEHSVSDVDASAANSTDSIEKNESSVSENERTMPAVEAVVPEADAPPSGSNDAIAEQELSVQRDERSIEATFLANIELNIAAFRQGNPIPPIAAMGSDANAWTSVLNPANFSTSPDGHAYVKAFQQGIYLQSLTNVDVQRHVQIDDLATNIRQINWIDDTFILDCDQTGLWKVALNTDITSNVEVLAAQRLLPESECISIEIPAKTGVLIAALRSEGQANEAMPDGYLFDVTSWSPRQAAPKLSELPSLRSSIWPPMITCDRTGSRVLVSERDSASSGSFLLFNTSSQTSIDLSESAVRELATIEQAVFVDQGQSLLLVGRRATEIWKSIYWVRPEGNQATIVRRLSSEFGEPWTVRSDEQAGFIVLRSNALTHCTRAKEQWVERVINVSTKIEAGVPSTFELSQATVSDFVVAPHRWLLAVTADLSLVAAKLYDVEPTESDTPATFDCFKLDWQAPTETVTRLDIAGNHLIATTIGGSSTWYQLDELLLVAETRLSVRE